MSFEAALAGNRAPSRVGDVALRYEKSLLIGESRKAAAFQFAPEAAFIVGAGASFATISILVMPQDALSAPLAIAFAAVAAGFFITAAVLERRVRRPRRFVLNFAAETLRMEDAPLLGRRTVVVHFDAVRDLRIEPGRGGTQRVIVYFARVAPRSVRRAPTAHRFVLLDEVRKEDDAALDRAFRLFKGAFGLGIKPALPSPGELDASSGPVDGFDGGDD